MEDSDQDNNDNINKNNVVIRNPNASQNQIPEAEGGAIPPPFNALAKYMNQLATNGYAAEMKFTRRGTRWNVQDPNNDTPHVLYSFYAPWVRKGVTEVRTTMSAFQRAQVRKRREDEQKRIRREKELLY